MHASTRARLDEARGCKWTRRRTDHPPAPRPLLKQHRRLVVSAWRAIGAGAWPSRLPFLTRGESRGIGVSFRVAECWLKAKSLLKLPMSALEAVLLALMAGLNPHQWGVRSYLLVIITSN